VPHDGGAEEGEAPMTTVRITARNVLGPAALAGIVLALAACGRSDEQTRTAGPAGGAAQGAGAAVTIQTFQFQPSPVEVKAGTRVTWNNHDDITHTITADTPDNRSGRFDLPLNGKDTSAAFTFSEPGTYTYFCSRHESMRGEVHVTS